MAKNLTKYYIFIFCFVILNGCKSNDKEIIYYGIQDVVPDIEENLKPDVFEDQWGENNFEKLKNIENFELFFIGDVIDFDTKKFIGKSSMSIIPSYELNEVEEIKKILKDSSNYLHINNLEEIFEIHYKLIGSTNEENLTILIDTLSSKIGIIDITGLQIKKFDIQKLQVFLHSKID